MQTLSEIKDNLVADIEAALFKARQDIMRSNYADKVTGHDWKATSDAVEQIVGDLFYEAAKAEAAYEAEYEAAHSGRLCLLQAAE